MDVTSLQTEIEDLNVAGLLRVDEKIEGKFLCKVHRLFSSHQAGDPPSVTLKVEELCTF